MLLIETRVLGRKARPLDRWSVPLPPSHDEGGGDGLTLRELITRIVRAEVGAFRERQRAMRLVRVLSDDEITAAAGRGKVDSGGRPPGAPVDAEGAVATALQGFEDGLYL
ncbi:MAG TPA: hypothetical protein VFX39_09025, partial [Gemmatimonadaceae bacterium]|nr:hypothetical protein [Gemmatimonadaceae bacterium]